MHVWAQIWVGADWIWLQTPEQKQAQSLALQVDCGWVRAGQLSAQAGSEPYWLLLRYWAEVREGARARARRAVRVVVGFILGVVVIGWCEGGGWIARGGSVGGGGSDSGVSQGRRGGVARAEGLPSAVIARSHVSGAVLGKWRGGEQGRMTRTQRLLSDPSSGVSIVQRALQASDERR